MLRPRLAAGRMATLAAFAVLALPAVARAHEIPTSVVVQAFVKPEGGRLRLLVRAPLEAMRDVNFPLVGPGYLDLARLGNLLEDAAQLWIADYTVLYEDGRPLARPEIMAVRLSLPSDRSFGTWDEAIAHMTAPGLATDTEIYWQQAMMDVLLEVPIGSAASDFAIDPTWAHLGLQTTTVLRFVTVEGSERPFQFTGNPGLVRLDPSWYQAALRFVRLGFEHIMDGLDHLLFVLCLVIPIRRFRPLVAIVTAFTVAHSITLIASASGLAPNALWFPPFIETLIALSIVYMAIENIVGARLERRWMMAFAFGLVHGFGFSFVLRESLQFAGAHLLTSLLAFNVGVELGQIAVLAVAIPVLSLLFSRVVPERMGTIILSTLVAHTAWHWMGERFGTLREYDVQMPAFDTALLVVGIRWMMLALILIGAVWGLSGVFGRLTRQPAAEG